MFSSRGRHTRYWRDWSSDVCSSDLSDTLNHRFQPYVNDSWKVRQNLTLNLGLAYRYDTNLWNHDLGHPAIIAPLFGKGTAPSPSDKNNWSPRAGFRSEERRVGKECRSRWS